MEDEVAPQKDKGEVGKSYDGHMLVINCTGEDITDLRLEHRCGQAQPSTLTKDKLENQKATSSVGIVALSGHNDLWDLEFKRGGTQYRRNNKQCNMPNSSTMNVAVIILYAKSFSVITPDSGPCTLNHY